MEIIEVENGQKIFLWMENIHFLDEGALKQAQHLALLPFNHLPVAIMPDSHKGFGMPIGAVLATDNVIVPNAVGSDIGCGMTAIETGIPNDEMTSAMVQSIMKKVERTIPVGFNRHKSTDNFEIDYLETISPNNSPSETFYEYMNDTKIVNMAEEYGTLGGGNHFIEMDRGTDGQIWIMLHSGSRVLGKYINDYYNKEAQKINEKWHTSVPKEWDLAFLPVDEQLAQDYIDDMKFAMGYAKGSRKFMLDRFMDCVKDTIPDVDFNNKVRIDIWHNYASLEKYHGNNVWVHRKGAVDASKGKMGIIAGSQGTASYITLGLGNPKSYNTSSHGAGRVMGRKEAQRILDLQSEQLKMNGIYNNMTTQHSLDEAPSCYKDIEWVMQQETDLTLPVVRLRPVGVVKG